MDEDLLQAILALFFLVVWPLIKYFAEQNKKREQEAALAAGDEALSEPFFVEEPDVLDDDVPYREPASIVTARAAWIDQAALEVAQLSRQASELAASSRHERVTHRFVDPLEQFVLKSAQSLAGQLRTLEPDRASISADIDVLWRVYAQIQRFVRQRHNPKLSGKVGDADALAGACYQPLVAFASSRGMRLTSTVPVTELGDFDLATWTGFIPTGLAPLWLPKDFFRKISWWPAVAHEIAHDFLAATEGLEEQLRDELGLPDEAVGRMPLRLDRDDLEGELFRICGGWFEELFCDVVGTMMVGPAYAWAMVEHFAAPKNPLSTQVVTQRGTRYDHHPPRLLRLMVSAYVLELIGLAEVADDVRHDWARRHGGWPETILFPYGNAWLPLPLDAVAPLALYVAQEIYQRPFKALSGHRMCDIPGVDFGPHAIAESERVAAELLAGRIPHLTDARWVIAGATVAWHQAPDQQRRIIRLVRKAIRATDSREHAHDAYDPTVRVVDQAAVDLREMFLLREIMAPPLALRHGRGGMLARVTNPRR
jgi:hypothetical protein